MKSKKISLWMKLLYIILLIIIIVVIVLISILLRKHIMIQNIRKMLEENNKYTNYYAKKTIYEDGDSIAEDADSIIEYYRNGEDSKIIKEIVGDQKVEKYEKSQTINIYAEAYLWNKKFCDLNAKTDMEKIELNNEFIEKLGKLSMLKYIKTIWNLEIEMKDNYYNIKENSKAIEYLGDDIKGDNEEYDQYTCELYINKDTGLIESLKYYNSGNCFEKVTYTYEFNSVTDEMLEEPDISEYEVVTDE